MGPVKVLGRAVQKVADSIMMTLIGNDTMYIYNVSWVRATPARVPVLVRCRRAPRERWANAAGQRARFSFCMRARDTHPFATR
jgi:hypothetical protein